MAISTRQLTRDFIEGVFNATKVNIASPARAMRQASISCLPWDLNIGGILPSGINGLIRNV